MGDGARRPPRHRRIPDAGNGFRQRAHRRRARQRHQTGSTSSTITSRPTRRAPPFERFVRTLFGPLFAQVGFESMPADSDGSAPCERRSLKRSERPAATPTCGPRAHGSRSRARAAARRSTRRSPARSSPWPPSTATARCRTRCSRRPTRGQAPDEHYRYLYALARFRDPALIDRALDYALTSKLRSQDTSGFLSRFLAQESARPRTWAFLKQHWSGPRAQGHDLRRRLGPHRTRSARSATPRRATTSRRSSPRIRCRPPRGRLDRPSNASTAASASGSARRRRSRSGWPTDSRSQQLPVSSPPTTS